MTEDEAYRLHRQAVELYLVLERMGCGGAKWENALGLPRIRLRAYERVCRRRDKMQAIRAASKPTTQETRR